MSILTSLNQEFSAITADSRKVQAGALFLAYPGVHSDGRNYIAQAIQTGAAAVIWEQEGFNWNANWAVKNLAIADLKLKVGAIAAEFYHYPSSKLNMIGVTGTNGKTSVSQWVAQCLTVLGQKAAVLGTIGNGFIGAQTEAVNTTPDAVLLQAMLADFVQQNANAVAMEVSSHGLDQGRVNGVAFDIAVLTNLSRDHLDYHETMEAYAAAKQKLFAWEGLGTAIVNADDEFGRKLASAIKAKGKVCVSYGFGDDVAQYEVRASHLRLHDAGLSMQVSTPQGETTVKAAVLGRFNAYNVLAVLATLLALNIGLNEAVAAIARIKPVLGRMQQFGGDELPLVVIDYAHTPDAMEKVLTTLKEQVTGDAKLICVFGCGGDRDVGKRPLMGNIACKFADEVIVTSDNPRSEDPQAIIHAIVSDIKTTYAIEPDRASAIRQAIANAKQGDIILLAGKGHENYQEIAGVKHPFDDALIAQAALKTYQTKLANGATK